MWFFDQDSLGSSARQLLAALLVCEALERTQDTAVEVGDDGRTVTWSGGQVEVRIGTLGGGGEVTWEPPLGERCAVVLLDECTIDIESETSNPGTIVGSLQVRGAVFRPDPEMAAQGGAKFAALLECRVGDWPVRASWY